MDYEKKIDIPFRAKDSELKGWEYTIPEGFTAEIKDGKVIVREKESEDERIRKWMINQLSAVINTESAKEFDPTGYEMAIKALSWLEKQKINTEGDFGRGYDCGYEACLNSHGAEWFEKHNEQKPTNSEKPKEYKSSENVEMIVMSPYEAEFCQKFCDHTLDHYSPDGWKLIKNYYAEFKKIVMRELAEQKSASYSPLCNTINDKIREYVTNHFVTDTVVKTDVKSIVKAMEEGVRLGKEEQKPAEWSEEDKEMLTRCVAAIPVQGDEIMPTSYLNKLRNWLESLPERFNLQPKQGWSEKEMKVLDSIIDDYEKAAKSFCGYDGKIGLLKAIRDNEYDLSKQEWSEEDKIVMLNTIIGDVSRTLHSCGIGTDEWNIRSKAIHFLKSLRPSWKPSEEQMEALNAVLEHEAERVGSSKELEKANALYEQLQRL